MAEEQDVDEARVASPLAPGLYLVATPIGNLEDITLRALRILRSVDRIACEDTRQTQKLLNHYNISKSTLSYHSHNESERTAELLEHLKAGGRVAVVSDAGTPAIADPGAEITAAAIAAGVPVFPVPGANAAISAFIASGLGGSSSFSFIGFLPAKAGQRRTAMEDLRTTANQDLVLICYEAPHRILDTLADLEDVFGPLQHIVVARELTKIHEEFLRGPVSEVRRELGARQAVRGEFVLLFSPATAVAEPVERRSISQEVRDLITEKGLTEKEALKQVARQRRIGKSEAYREFQRDRSR